MKAKKIDDKYGLDVELKPFARGSDAYSAFRAKAVDVVLDMGTNTAAEFFLTGVPIKVIRAFQYPHFSFLVRRDSSIKRIQELKGQKIAVTSFGATSYWLTAVAFNALGMDVQKDVKIQTGAPAVLLSSLAKGEIVSVTLWEPYVTQAIKTGDFKILVDPAEIYTSKYKEQFYHTCISVQGDFYDKNRDPLRQFLRAISESIGYTLKNSAESNEISSKTEINLSPDDLGKVRSGWKGWVIEDINDSQLREINNMYRRMFDMKILEGEVDARKFWLRP
jgi:ABC-type nitrate/sulfonate/bicarbonate transport system substrate-binding protein